MFVIAFDSHRLRNCRAVALRRRNCFACLFLVAVTLAVYWPARHYQFVAYDDDNYVYQNPMVRSGLTWQGVQWAFIDRQANNWHPLTWLSHMADCQIFGLNAGGPHMVNVAFHCANAVLLFLLLQMMTRRAADASSCADYFWRNLFVAALFALHPLRVESVAWISERKDVLSAFFGLLALLSYARYACVLECGGLDAAFGTTMNPQPTPACLPNDKNRPTASPSPGGEGRENSPKNSRIEPLNQIPSRDVSNSLTTIPPLPGGEGRGEGELKKLTKISSVHGKRELISNSKRKTQNAKWIPNSFFYRLSLFFFACSLLSKPMLVTLPLIMLLLDYWPLQCLQPFNASTLQRLLLEKWPFFLLTAIFCAITLVAQRPGLPGQNLALFPRIETVAVNYLGYIEKLLWPQNLSFLYLRPDNIPIGQFFLAVLVLFSVSALVFATRRRCPALVTGWLWFLIVLFPVSGIVSLGRLSIADRYTYLPGIGFYLMMTYGLAELAAKLLPSRPRQILLTTGAAIILAVCAILSRQQLASWQNTQTLYEHALKVDPNNTVAKQNLHIYLFERAYPDIRKPPPE